MQTNTSATESISAQRNYQLIVPFVSALLIVLFLFFIDEGYYDFRWMTDPGNWLAFLMYLAVFFVIQSLIYNFGLSYLKGPVKNILMLGVVTVGIVFLILWLVF